MNRSCSSPGERGFAVIVVLWWVVLLAVLGAQLAGSAQLEARRAANARRATLAAVAAEGALQEAIFHLEAGEAAWPIEGAAHDVAVAGGVAHVLVLNEAAKISLNHASAGLLRALLAQLGIPPASAAALADAIVDWRTATPERRPLGAKAADYRAAASPYGPPNAEFETLGELALVRGMTPAILAALSPHLSAYQSADPDPALASQTVRRAVTGAGELDADPTGPPTQGVTPPVLVIDIQVEMQSGGRARRRTIVRLAADTGNRPYQVLATHVAD